MLFKKIHVLFLLMWACSIKAQDNFVLTSINKKDLNQVKIKWYSSQFLYPEGVVIYQKEITASTWTKVNSTPIKKADYKLTTEDLKQDKELKNYTDLINSGIKLEGVALLGAYVKSFKSEAFSLFLGIEYIDSLTPINKSLQYKVCMLKNGEEIEIGVSKPVTTGTATEIFTPKEIQISTQNKKTTIKWLPETSRYYAVDIYRMFDSLGSDRKKINKDPIIVSKTKGKDGTLNYPEQFYVDEKLKEDTTYYYSFKVVDFFGEESEFSKPIKVFIKDLNAPSPPLFVKKEVSKKTITLHWHKSLFEKDFIGYTIYRAYRSEKKYTKITQNLLKKTDSVFVDNVSNYALYRYVIASVDKAGNEGVAEEISIETIDEEPPAIPKNLLIKSDTGRVELSWMKNTEPDLWGYMVYQTVNKNTNNDAYVLITPRPLTNNVFKQNLAVNSKNKFLYKVLAIDSSYNKSELSDFAIITLPDVIPPSEPFIFDYRLDEKNNVVINFFKNTELDLKGYNLYRVYKEEGKEKMDKVNDQLINYSARTYTDRTFENEGLVSYYMVAIDSSNNISKKSNTVKLNIAKTKEQDINEFKNYVIKPLKTPNTYKLQWNLSNTDSLFYVVYTKQKDEDYFEPVTKNLNETTCVLSLKFNTLVQIRAYSKKGLVCKSDTKLIEPKK